MAEHNELGAWGEEEAVKYLRTKGYEILEQDWKMGKRDLDVIALTEDESTMVFVEVKTRTGDDYQQPQEAVTRRKIKNLAVAANAYVKTYHLDVDIRFDIISIIGHRPFVERIEHIEDAFNPLLV